MLPFRDIMHAISSLEENSVSLPIFTVNFHKNSFIEKEDWQNEKYVYNTPPPPGLKIYGTSAASYAENKCSTYHRYASALFSANSLHLYPLFSKASISKKQTENLFLKVLILFPSVNNIYAAAETLLLLINARECASFRKLFISSISTYINSGWFFYRHRCLLLCNGCRLSCCVCVNINGLINLCAFRA